MVRDCEAGYGLILMPASEIRIIPIPGLPEIRPGQDLATLLLRAMRGVRLRFRSGDILIVKHKIVSKAEGRIVPLATVTPRDSVKRWAAKYGLDARLVELALSNARRVIRQKRGILITETALGFICANSGVDVSNLDGGRSALLLPRNPDRSAAKLRRELSRAIGIAVPVIISDSFGRPWRMGLCEFAIGVAGMKPLLDYRGNQDPHGYRLHASEEAVADELACAAGLVCGKLARVPAAIIRGYKSVSGPGSVRDLIRPQRLDLFR